MSYHLSISQLEDHMFAYKSAMVDLHICIVPSTQRNQQSLRSQRRERVCSEDEKVSKMKSIFVFTHSAIVAVVVTVLLGQIDAYPQVNHNSTGEQSVKI
jgi:hypothetical protein